MKQDLRLVGKKCVSLEKRLAVYGGVRADAK